ncbi:FkbM family methyltransferase [Erythrobacter sp. JK5]|uniref:FkbM family methyltransferase n=1 Tax=Erythrobacter sp. JK5 TaxID=2829500 RepID=UPI001BAC8362|nr:FkbM family methyltransferase [Erythrobacter sp. JK5]QUL37670.1 FkbM family methyltransferase [Erythrobacter sp. JK5]
MGRLTELRRKVKKTNILMRNRIWRDAAFKGVAAAIEHRHTLRDLDFGTCIDVGANRGQFSLLVRGLKPDCRIYAFEPLAEPAAHFEEVHRPGETVTLYRHALGSQRETREIQVHAKSDSSSFLPPEDVRQYGKIAEIVASEEVRIERLDDVLKPADLSPRTLLKLDVQGFEAEVLAGASGLLDRVEWIYTEVAFAPLYAGQPLFNDLHDMLTALGYVPKRIGHVSGTPVNVQSTADFLYQKSGGSTAA